MRCRRVLPTLSSSKILSNHKGKVVVKSSVEDLTRTSTMKDFSTLGNIDPERFFEECKALTADTDGRNALAAAIMRPR